MITTVFKEKAKILMLYTNKFSLPINDFISFQLDSDKFVY